MKEKIVNFFKKHIDIFLKTILTLISLMPVGGAVAGLMGANINPTREMYNTDEAYTFIIRIMADGYITYINAIVFVLAIYFLWTRRVALGAILILPITVNIAAFHQFLNGGLFTSSSSLALVMGIVNLTIIYRERNNLKFLFRKTVDL